MGQSHWISLPRVEGSASRQAHADLPTDTFERELGREGFYGPSTQMYHRHAPTGWSDVQGPLRPRALDTTYIEQAAVSPWQATELLGNQAVKIRFWKSDEEMNHLVRNADGDELLFVHQGEAELFCDYGHLSIREGDYVVLPRGTMWRITHDIPVAVLLVEASNDSYRLPDKGLVGDHAIFDPAMLDTPKIDDAFITQQTEEPWQVQVKRRGEISTLSYPFNPLDAVGWHGSLAPVRINWRDIRPLMSARYHVPPSAHTTFVASRFVVCTFVPRPMESDPGALKVPFFHNNDDYDEVIFYHQGDFFSRDNIHPGMLTLHPAGITHGPHPKALEIGQQALRKETNEVAVMIDSRDALALADMPVGIEWPDYVKSWQGGDV